MVVSETNDAPVESGSSFSHDSDENFSQRARGVLKNKHKNGQWVTARLRVRAALEDIGFLELWRVALAISGVTFTFK
jgi:hypothetical protein